jgi:hypothetical protein
VIAAANPGCTLQIAAHLQRKGQPREIVHPMQLLARSIAGGDAGGDGRGRRRRTVVGRVLRRLRPRS